MQDQQPQSRCAQEVFHVCGHKGFYPSYTTQEKLNALELKLCNMCSVRQIQAENAIEIGGDGYPILRGSEKQVKWALAIRGEAIRKFEAGEGPDYEFHKHNRAGYWIENRHIFNK